MCLCACLSLALIFYCNVTLQKPKVRCTKICRKCGKIGHIEKYCLTTEGGCVFIGDLPPSYTEEEIRTLVEKESGVKVLSESDTLES